MSWRRHWLNLASILAVLSLAVCLAAPILCFAHAIDKRTYIICLDFATLAWFLSAPFWLTPGLFGKKFEEAAARAWLRVKSANK